MRTNPFVKQCILLTICCLTFFDQLNASVDKLTKLERQGKHAEAIELAFSLLKRPKTTITDKAKIHKKLSIVYFKLAKKSSALIHVNKAIELALQLQNDTLLAKLLNNKGIIYTLNQELDSCLFFYKKALKLKLGLHDYIGVYSTYNNIGVIHEKSNQLDSAILYYRKALHIIGSNGNDPVIAKSWNNLGNVFRKQQKFDSARVYYLKSLEVANRVKDYNMQAKVTKNLMLFYQDQVDYESAWPYAQRYHSLKDSLYSAEMMGKIERLEAEYESTIQKQKIAIQEARLKKNATYIGLSVSTIVLLLLLIAGGIYAYRKTKANLKQIEENRKQAFINYVRGQETERMRIAYRLHDDLNESLMGAKISDDKDHYVRQAQEILNQATSNVFSETIRQFGLNDGIEKHVMELYHQKIRVYFGSNVQKKSFPSWFEASVFRIVTGLIDAAVKAEMTEMHLYLTFKDQLLEVNLITEKLRLDFSTVNTIAISLLSALDAEVIRDEEVVSILLNTKQLDLS